MTTMTPTIQAILDAVCNVYQVTMEDLRGESRAQAVARPRAVAMTLVLRYARRPYIEVAALFGRRDHTTVISAEAKGERLIATTEEGNMAARAVADVLKRSVRGLTPVAPLPKPPRPGQMAGLSRITRR